MSKRNSSTPSNTLFKYFSKTPPSNKKTKSVDEELNGSPTFNSPVSQQKEQKHEPKKRERLPTESPKAAKSDSDDEIPLTIRKRKRIRLNPVDSDDSDVENKAENTIDEPQTTKPSFEKKLQDSFKYETNQSPKAKGSTIKSSNDATPKAKIKPLPNPESQGPISYDDNWIHCKLDWLKPDKIRDANKHRPDDPDYDPRTLYVPPAFYNDQTPAHRQWWEIKSSHFDCVLFFKVGKFYELYHMDAAVGVNELGFSYMKGEFAHSGFPESAYARMADTLVSKGYKVARVEQTETPDMMQERCRKTGKTSKWDKVVRREICQVALRGAVVAGAQDSLPKAPMADYMLCVVEESNHKTSYGVCFLDTSIGHFYLGQFEDDKHSSRLLTTLAHYPPALIIYDRKATSQRTVQLLSLHCHSARREPQQIWPPEKTLKVMAEKYYRTNGDGEWPEGIKPFLHEGDALGLTPAPNCYLAVKALGGCITFLTDALLDIQILGMAQFNQYAPPDVLNQTLSQDTKVENAEWEGGCTMVLDAITLKNLRIVQDEGCLYDKLNFCSTAFGKRLLHHWVCAPSCRLTVIKERQKAVKFLLENRELCQDAQSILTALPDLERLLAKVHALGNLNRSKYHPDARAIFYEEKTYSKRKVLDFISVLNGFTAALKLSELFSGTDSVLLKTITQLEPEGRFPDYRETLQFFKQSFNQEQAEKEGKILPGKGVDQEYDNILRMIQELEDELKEYLREQEKHFRCRLTFVGSDKKRYQLEVPESAVKRADEDYQLESSRKGFKRFSTAETKDFLARMMAAEEQKANVLKDLSRRIFEKFSNSYNQWEGAVKCVAILDVLLSLAEFARQQSGDVCLPDVSYNGEKHFIKITDGRHPCIPIVEDFIPNDTSLGVDGPNLLLLTGPNMGGKSTLMRQVGLLAVLAHMGSYVPASQMSLSLIDRVFTRLGARDAVLSGQSTFLVEMSEAAAIVRHATARSLLLIDELGRGTSTHDGAAIASAVCAELAQRGCRGVFSTHYHSMVRHLAHCDNVLLGHMACMVETDESALDNENVPEETITFLYKLSPGACPKSYGFNAAFLAGIPPHLTKRARAVASSVATAAERARTLRDVVKGKSVREALAQLVI